MRNAVTSRDLDFSAIQEPTRRGSGARSTFSNTFAPLAMSCGREHSLGEWLMPPMLGMEIRISAS